MEPFVGFPSGKSNSTPLPAVFFIDLLPQIDHIGELKVTLYVFWFLNQQEGPYRFVTWHDFTEDTIFMGGFAHQKEDAIALLDEALEKAVLRGTILRTRPAGSDDPKEAVYFLNSARGRAALRAMANHEWSPSDISRSHPALKPERPNIFRLYEENIGTLTPMMAEILRDAERTYPEEWIEDAVRIAVANNVRRWRYIEAILKSWQEKGRDGTDRRDFEKDRRKYLEGDFAGFLEYEAFGSPDLPGDPNCPICKGIGYVSYDYPVGHPDFGKVFVCSCRQAEVNRKSRRSLLRFSNLENYQDKTFENFNISGRGGLTGEQANTLLTARDLASQFSRTLQGWLLILGGYGCGKTHLAAAVANFAVSLGVPTMFLTVPDLLDWLRFAYSDENTSFEERFDEIRNVHLLVLDDLGTQNTTPWAAEKLFQIINHRYTNRLPTVITSNQELKDMDGRISSRLQDPELVGKVKISAPDYRHATQDTNQPLLSTLHMHQSRTFGSFTMREREKLIPESQQSLEKAFKAAHRFSENPQGWLVLMGPYGVGKTHLAASIGNYCQSMGESPVFVVVPDLLDHLRATFSPNSSISYDRLFDQIRSADLLILDDLGTQSATPWAREKLYQIFNYRYNAELPTVITTSSSLEEMDPRIRSRMLDRRICNIYFIDVPPYLVGPNAATVEKPRRGRRPSMK